MESKDYQLTEGRILRVIQDDNAESPDTWGNTDMFLVYDHRQFTVRRKGFEPQDIANHFTAKKPDRDKYSDEDEYNLDYNDYAESIDLNYNNYYIFPVAAYIHSGVVLNLTNSLSRQGWDTSVTGFILVKKESDSGEDILTEEIAKKYAEGLIETWNQYLSGDVWGFQVFKKVKYWKISDKDLESSMSRKEVINVSEETIELEEEDSCWGFYGSDIKTNGILDHINYKLIENEK